MEEENSQKPEVEKSKVIHIGWPKDATALYMENRQAVVNAKDDNDVRNKLMESINIGSALLEGDTLKAEVDTALKTKLPKRKMEITSNNVYAISTLDDTSGFIKVRVEDVEMGEKCIINQQAGHLIPDLRILDNKIFQKLIEKGTIPKYGMYEMLLKEMKGVLEKDGIQAGR